MQNVKQNLENFYEDIGGVENDFRNYNLIQLIADRVEGRCVLDVGCGEGALLAELQKRGKDVTGLEPSAELVRRAGERYPGISVAAGTVENMADALGVHTFDTIVMVDVLEHVKDDCAALTTLRTHLQKDGSLVIVVPAYQWLYGKRDKSIGHYRRYTAATLRSLLEKQGFSIKTMRYWNMLGVLPYGFSERVLQKPLEVHARSAEGNAFVRRVLHWWFKYIERYINLGFGLSVICVATREK